MKTPISDSVKQTLTLLFFISLIPWQARSEDCSLSEKQIVCPEIKSAPVKNQKDLGELGKILPLKLKVEKKSLCDLGVQSKETKFDDFVQIETTRQAQWLQKIQALREGRRLAGIQEISDLDQLEKILKDSSLLSDLEDSKALTHAVQKETLWHPKQIPSPIKNEMGLISQGLKQKEFPKDISSEMNEASRISQACQKASLPLQLLFDSSKSDSPRTYHFKKTLLAQMRASEVKKAIDSCPLKTQDQSCKMKAAKQTRHFEDEFEFQLCTLRHLFPNTASELNPIRLEIPSAAGDLVTEGPGERPTEAEAKSDRFRWNVACPEDFTAGGLLRMAAGGVGSFLTHELSHEAVARVQGEKLDWDSKTGTWRSHTTPNKHRAIAIAGLASHSVGSEVIAQNFSPDSQFQKGWLFWNMFNTVSYFGKDWAGKNGAKGSRSYASGGMDSRGSGDLRAFSKKESYVMGTLMGAHQLYTGYRYLQSRQNYQCKKEWD
ncbi:MAG: hypothetical protein ACAH59_05640 [Pseudobdellovibrionaceae bacterium]